MSKVNSPSPEVEKIQIEILKLFMVIKLWISTSSFFKDFRFNSHRP